MAFLARTLWHTWGGLALTAPVCAAVDVLTATKLLPPSAAAELLVVVITLQLIRWHTSRRRRET